MMPRYRYQAVAASGEVLQGEMEAASRLSVIDRLRGDGHLPVRAEELNGAATGRSSAGVLGRRRGYIAVASLTRELATLLSAGLALDRALMVLGKTAHRKPDREFIARLLKELQAGNSLAAALEPYREALPGFYVGMIRAGEAGGGLDIVLGRLAEAMEKSRALREAVRSALYYPAFVLITTALSIVVLLTLVLPEFRPLFEDSGAAMPFSMAVILSLSDALRDYWWMLLGILLGGLLGAKRLYELPSLKARLDRQILRAPVLGALVLKLEIARFARTLGTLLGGGVTLLNAMVIAGETIANRVLAKSVVELGTRLRKGEGLSGPLMQAELFPPLAVQLVQVGEESGQLEAMLLRIANIYDDEVKQTIQRLLALLVPAITVFLGVVVGSVVATVLSAILSSYNLPF
jgi:general secretion pathway protein F